MRDKAEIFFDAITLLPEDIVEEAQEYRFRKKQAGWKKVGSLAACLALIASISLLALPRGCGAAAPGADMNSAVSTDSCAPADSEPMPEPGAAPGAPEAGYDYGLAETAQFSAVVLEIDGGSLLVEPLEGEQIRSSHDRIAVYTGALALPELAAGDEVRIVYDGQIQTGDPAGITGVTAVERLAGN